MRVHNIFSPKQYGLRKGISTDNATHKLTDYIHEAWNNKMNVLGIFVTWPRLLIA